MVDDIVGNQSVYFNKVLTFEQPMKRNSCILKVFAFAFTAIVLFTVSVHETHYLFAEHHSAHEHCENHLHGEDEHADCAVCKFDVSFFSDNILHPAFIHQNFIGEVDAPIYTSVISSTDVSFNPLRGPPFIG